MRTLLFILVTLSLLMTSGEQTYGQDGDDCNPQEVSEWMAQRQAWRNATTETWQQIADARLSFDAMPSWLDEFHIHMQAIADLARPVCADEALLWTFYYYDAMGRFWVCAAQKNDSCVTEMYERFDFYGEQIEVALTLLKEIAGITDEEYDTLYGELRPDGWTWPPDTLREYFPATYIEGTLDFEGIGDFVSDPVTIPKGIYRVSLETEDTQLSVDMVVILGECYVGNSSWDTGVFSFEGNGAQSLITSEECDVIWQVTDADGFFKISFGKMN